MDHAPPPTLEEVRRRLDRIGQAHVLRFHDSLAPDARNALLLQVRDIEPERLPALIEQYIKKKPLAALSGEPEPAPYYARDGAGPGGHWDRAKARAAGEDLLRRGKVAAFTVAGGQGSRLGFDGPKGIFQGTPVTRKPLFAVLAEWIIASQQRYGSTIPWYIMTSPINHETTVSFFRTHGCFGLSETNIMFFSQGVLPSLEIGTGKLLLDERAVIAVNPDGHGGSLRALFTSGAVDDMRRRGIEQISYVQIDNPLARVIDPVFIGLHAAAPDSSAEMSSKMVAKTDPAEKVGVFCRVAGKTCVIEYSDLPPTLAAQRGPDGRLRFCAGSIAIHMISVDFVSRLNVGGDFGLPLHRAEKKVPFIDPESGRKIQPEKPNAVKLEAFVFDALPLCRRSLVYETDRIDEFAPIKNAEGADSPATCAAIQTERAARWLEANGVKVPRDDHGTPLCTLEISPLTAMEPQDLAVVHLPRTIEKGAELAL